MSVIHVIVHGLIALVPTMDANGMANHMTALLVDGREKPAEFQQCFASHHPGITVQTATNAECVAADCDPEGVDDCTCSLVRKEVSLQAQLPPERADKKRKVGSRPERELPFDVNKAQDFSYVANLSGMGYKLDEERFLHLTPPPPELIARMSFSFEEVRACSLGTRRDEGSHNVHPMSFRPHSVVEKAGESSQALSQMVVASFTTNQDPVKLTIADFGGGNPRTLTLKPINGEYKIELFNMRMEENGRHDLPPDHPCDDGVGRDFAFFYKLVKDPPTWDKRPIPHVKYTRWKSVKDLEIKECRQIKSKKFPNSHPICALASFISDEEETR